MSVLVVMLLSGLSMYALGLDPCLFRGKLKWNEADHKLVAAWIKILLTFAGTDTMIAFKGF
jgi:hypothetical protein